MGLVVLNYIDEDIKITQVIELVFLIAHHYIKI